jgi:cysteine desulfurase/selenocysteine lyase
MSHVDWEAVRAEFPSLRNWTHLNTATFGQLPARTVEAMACHLAHRDELACEDFLDWFDDIDRVRGSIGRLIHCAADDIAFVPNASTALGILLAGIEWQIGDRIVTLQDEFPNNHYAPAVLERHNVELVETPWERFYDTIDERTRLVVLSEVNYANGFRAPLAEIVPFLRARGVLVFVDGTQSVGALCFDTAALQPDMLAVHGYKWLLSPNGASFMYVRPEVREWLSPNAIGWRSHWDWRNVDNLHHGMPELPSGAEKYEGGMLPFALLYALGASVEMMLEIGPAAIEQRVLDLADGVRAILRECGAAVSDYRSPVVAGRFENADVSRIARELRARRVLVAARHGNLRVSPHFYNNEEDQERFANALRDALEVGHR